MLMISISDVTLRIAQFLPEPHAGLLSGILFGAKADIPRDLYDALVTTGTLHIVALSGTNITIMTTLVSLSLLWIVSRRIASLLTIIIIIGFIWFVGPSPSVIRAAIMGCIALLGVIFGRSVWAFWSWIIAIFAMLVFDISNGTDISFQLSVFATLGMILYGGEKKKLHHSTLLPVTSQVSNQPPLGSFASQLISSVNVIVQSLKDTLRTDLRLTLAAQVFTIPIILFHFHRISLISPLPNLAIGWILPPLTMMGFIMVLCSLIWYPLGYATAWICWLALDYVIRVVFFFSSVPFASLGW